MTKPKLTKEDQEIKKSQVRVRVTYWSAAFLFAGGYVLTGALFWKGKYTEAKDMFLAILPVSAAVISFWFAGRKSG
ncbi:MAG: hypothetical protein OXG10_07235 [Candidatus Dadabacteria bacterium]|nr:hypothetical protein [Candidatus Dadabacteria bacterium]